MSIFYNNGTEEENLRMTITSYSLLSTDNVFYISNKRNTNQQIGSLITNNDHSYTVFPDVPIGFNNPTPITIFSNKIAGKNISINGNSYSDIDNNSKSTTSLAKSQYRPSETISEDVVYNLGKNTNHKSYTPPGSISSSENGSTVDTTNGGGWYCVYGVECNPAYTAYYDSLPEYFVGMCAANGPYSTETEASENCEYNPPEPEPITFPVSPEANEKVTGFYYTALITKITDISQTISNVVYGNQNYQISGNSKLVVSTNKYLEPGSYIRDISSLGHTSIYGDMILGQTTTKKLYYCFDTNKLRGRTDTYGEHICSYADATTSPAFPHPGWRQGLPDIVGGPFLDSNGCDNCTPPEPYYPGDPVDHTITDDELNEHYKFGYAGNFPVLQDGVYLVQLLNRDTYPLGTEAPLLPWTMPNKRPDSTWPQARPFVIAVSNGVVRFRPPLDVSSIEPKTYAWYGNYTDTQPSPVNLGPNKNGSCFTTTETEMTLDQAIILEATYENCWQSRMWTSEDERYLGSGGIYADTRVTNGLIIYHLYKILGYQDHYIQLDNYGNFAGGGTFSFDEFLQTYGICDRYTLSSISYMIGNRNFDHLEPLCNRKWTKDVEYLQPGYGPDVPNVFTSKLRECNWCGHYDWRNPDKTFITEYFYETDGNGNEYPAGANLKPCWPIQFKDPSFCANWVNANKIGNGPAPDYKPIVNPDIEPICQCAQE